MKVIERKRHRETLSGQTWSTEFIHGSFSPPLLLSVVSQPRLDLQPFLCGGDQKEVKMKKSIDRNEMCVSECSLMCN